MLMETMEGTSTDALWSWTTLDHLGFPLVAGPRTDDLLLVSGRPVVRGRSIVGFVLTGRWVDTGLLEELGRSAGAQVVLHSPDGGWAGARWLEAPPLGRVVQLQVGGTTIRVLGIGLGEEGSRTPAGEAYVVRVLTAGEIGGLASVWLRWGLLVTCLAVLAWLGWLTRSSGWYLRAAPRVSSS
jgi:hypothetical protein